jgi:hypothetical protein
MPNEIARALIDAGDPPCIYATAAQELIAGLVTWERMNPSPLAKGHSDD